MTIKQRDESEVMLPPQELHTFKLLGVPVQLRMDDLPAQVGVFWVVMQLVRQGKPNWSPVLRWPAALVSYGLWQAADTLHSVGHILSAKRTDAPVDAVVQTRGFQVIRYIKHDVTPQQHVGRAIGGPLMSGALVASSYMVWRIVRRVPIIGGFLGNLAETWLVANAVMLGASLTPSPTFDGSVLLKWGVASRTGEEALGDEAVQQAGFATVGGLFMAAGLLLMRGKLVYGLAAFMYGLYIIADLLVLRGKWG